MRGRDASQSGPSFLNKAGFPVRGLLIISPCVYIFKTVFEKRNLKLEGREGALRDHSRPDEVTVVALLRLAAATAVRRELVIAHLQKHAHTSTKHVPGGA